MTNDSYHTKYQRTYRQKKRQVCVYLTRDEYRRWKARADLHDNAIGRQLLIEAEAFAEKQRVPSLVELEELRALVRQIRGIGGLLNQISHHSNRVRRFLHQQQTRQLLMQLETTAHDFIRGASRSNEVNHVD